tara:strand:- start:11 stop:346 length:336 start_codon:yes stop_codon:yes gene_type:complete
MERILGKKKGIYALYKKDKLYYVGKSTDLNYRLQSHMSNKHQHKWDKFSLFIIKNPKYVTDVETALINIAKPTGNATGARIPKDKALQKLVKHAIREYARKAKDLEKAIRN